jgi:hypothetical protein
MIAAIQNKQDAIAKFQLAAVEIAIQVVSSYPRPVRL